MIKSVLLALCFCHSFLFGKIILLEKMSNFEREAGPLDNSALVLFDIDTLLTSKDAILGYHGEEIFMQLVKDVLMKVPANKYPEGFFQGRIYSSTQREVIEPYSISLVQELQKRVPVFAMTTFSPNKMGEIDNAVHFQSALLRTFSFNFQNSCPDITDLQFPKNPRNKSLSFGPGYSEGLLFASHHGKEEMLEKFLTNRCWFLKKVVVVDEDYRSLRAMEEAMKGRGVEFIGLYYTGRMTRAKLVDIQIAERQMHYLAENGIWLSDEEARAVCYLPIRD